MSACAEYDRLQSEVQNVLARLSRLTARQLQLFEAKDFPAVRRLDKELELSVGEKERSIGALREHMKEHHCQQWDPL